MARRNRPRRNRPRNKNRQRVLSRQERQIFRDIRKNQGRQAAFNYRRSIAANKGMSNPNQAPAPPGAPDYRYNLDTARGAIGAAQQSIDNAYTKNLWGTTYGQQGPFGGSVSWGRDPVTGQLIRNQQLAKPYQQMLSIEQQQGLAGRQAASVPLGAAMYNYAQPLDFSGAPQAPGAQGYEPLRRQVTDETYNRFARRYDPIFKQQDEEFEQRMMQQGIAPGSELYNRLRTQHKQTQEDARLNALSEAVRQGRAETETGFNIGTQARKNAIGEMMTLREQPLKEYASLMQAIPGLMQDQFQAQTPAQTQAPDVLGGAMGYYKTGMDAALARQKMANDWRMAKLQAQTQLAMKPEKTSLADQLAYKKALLDYQYQNDPRYQTPVYPTQGGPSNTQLAIAAGIPVIGDIISGMM